MRRVLIIPLALLFFISFAHVTPVQACSGVPHQGWALDTVLSEYPTIVVGRIHTVSESAFNAFLHIEQVIKGDPINEYIIFTGDSPTEIAFLAERRGSRNRCPAYSVRLPSGSRFIAGLYNSRDTGNYAGGYWGTIFTENSDGIIEARDPYDSEATKRLTYDEIIAYAAQQLNETPRSPQSSVMPRPAVVRLTTDSGTPYILPIDQNEPFAIKSSSEPDCKTYKPTPCMDHVRALNGIDNVTIYPLGFDVTPYLNEDTKFKTYVEGETGVYSARSDLLAVWAGYELRVYATPKQIGLGNASSGTVHLSLLRTLTIDPDDTLIPGAGVWNPDGRTFAFSTESGVWLWDILPTDPNPRQLQFTTREPMLVRHFSPDGNFLNIEVASHRYYLDITTMQGYPDGLFSPDDRLLAAFDTSATEATTLTLYGLIPEFKPLRGWDDGDTKISQFEWVDKQSYLYATCGEPIPMAESPGFDKPWCKVFSTTMGWNANWTDGVLFDYDPVTKSLVTLIDGDTITFNGEVLEMAGIDSAIVDVELIPVIDLDYQKF